MLRLALSHATFYFEQMNSIEFAIRITASAILRAKVDMNLFARSIEAQSNNEELIQTTNMLKVLTKNLSVFNQHLLTI